MDSARFSTALTWCSDVYKDDVRKSSGAPAIHHPLGVCDLVLGAGGDEDTAIAALFHDFAEDKGGEDMLLKIRISFGRRVQRIVRDCSDTIPREYTMKEPWIQRKIAHIKHIATMQSDSRLVLAADTLHNTRDHVRGIKNNESWWKNFRANVYLNQDITPEICRASTLWYLEAKHKALEQADEDDVTNVLLQELQEQIWILMDDSSPLEREVIINVCQHVYTTFGTLHK